MLTDPILLNNLGRLYVACGTYKRAKAIPRRAIEAAEECWRQIILNSLRVRQIWAWSFSGPESEPSFRRGLEVTQALPPLRSRTHSACSLRPGSPEATSAEAFLRRTIAIQAKALPKNHPNLVRSQDLRAHVLRVLSRDEMTKR